MTTNAPGRNDPCPCGSGKKYKKCCIGKASVAEGPPASAPSAWDRLPLAERAKIAAESQKLDDLSNGALDAIEAKRYEEAARLCDELLRDFPDVIDGHERIAMLREAQGRFQEAADHYAKVLVMIEQDHGGFDPEVPKMFRQRREEALARAASKR